MKSNNDKVSAADSAEAIDTERYRYLPKVSRSLRYNPHHPHSALDYLSPKEHRPEQVNRKPSAVHSTGLYTSLITEVRILENTVSCRQ
jgi:hypothetical protein